MGHDGSGAFCGFMEDDIFAKQGISSAAEEHDLPVNVKNDKSINHTMYLHFKVTAKSKIKTIAKLLLLNIGLWPKRLKY